MYKTNLLHQQNDTRMQFSKELAGFLLERVMSNKSELQSLNVQITGDLPTTVEADCSHITNYLSYFPKLMEESQSTRLLKPKGRILIVLSYNEPFIMSVIPIINALVAGNIVTIKPSSKSREFVDKIWRGTENVSITDDLYGVLEKHDCVYFFGSHKVATEISKKCVELGVEFIQEVEGVDVQALCSGYDYDKEYFMSLFDQSFTHKGKSCQRISAVYIQKDEKARFIDKACAYFRDRYGAVEGIGDAYGFDGLDCLQGSDGQVLVYGGEDIDLLSQDDFFKEILFILEYSSIENLVNKLNRKKYKMGLNMLSTDNGLTVEIINNTNFARYTVNRTHINVGLSEGWGGMWPTGSGGYQDWQEFFSSQYEILEGQQDARL